MIDQKYPLSQKTIARFLIILVVILALVGGYFHAQLQTQKRRYKVLETKYNVLLDQYELQKTK